jgi:uncharacterized repeat protein (TIGR01451 family)
VLALFAATAEAHLIVDMKMSVRAPGFVAAGQQLTYEVVADDLANDNALGLVVTDTLPSGTAFVSVTAPGWNCGQSKGVVTCSAEQLGPGEHVITIKATAPSQSGPITNKAHITSLGSFDPATDNDDATNSVMVYTPSRCTAPAPVLLTPADNASTDQPPQFSWMPSATGATYVVRASVEGAAVREIARTTETSAGSPLDRGSVTWWVEATFTDCPPVASEHRRVTLNRAPSFKTSAIKSGLTSPSGLAFGPNGELYVTDEDDSVVLLVRLGEATTIAGAAGQYGAANGQFARFNHPTGITVTPLDGFVYVADSSNGSMRVLYTGGPFVPAFDIAGAAFSRPVAVAATFRGSLYVADLDGNMVRLMTPVPGTTGIFTTTDVASFSAPAGLAVAADGTLYVAEQGTGNIRKRAPNGDTSILAGGFQRPGALALDPFGNLYVCDRGTHLLQKVAPSGLVTTIASFGDPAGVAVASDLSVYVADKGNHAVRRVEIDTAAPEPTVSRRRSVGH